MSHITFGPKLGKIINANRLDDYTDAFRALLRAFDQLIMPTVLSNALAAPPSSPSNGDAYIVVQGATGAWTSQDNKIAVWSTEVTTAGTDTKVPAWEFYTPAEGWEVWCVNLLQPIRFTSSSWTTAKAGYADEEIPAGVLDGVGGVGNTIFTLAHVPHPSTIKLYLNGARQQAGVGKDYTLVSNIVTYATAPDADAVHICDYRY
jgi:hypothetical protein